MSANDFKKFTYQPHRFVVPSVAMVVLKTDETIEDEARRYFSDKPISLLHSRIAVADTISEESLLQMQGQLQHSLSLLPSGKRFEVVAYACTSGATMIGEDKVATLIKSHVSTRYVTNPLTALLAQLQFLGVKKIVYLSPYVSNISQRMSELIEANGVSVLAKGSFFEPHDKQVASISTESIAAAVQNLLAIAPSAQAVFIACTNLKTEQVVASCQQRYNIPILTSNASLFWHIEQLL